MLLLSDQRAGIRFWGGSSSGLRAYKFLVDSSFGTISRLLLGDSRMFPFKATLPRPSHVGYWILLLAGLNFAQTEGGENSAFDRCGMGPVLTGRIVGGNETEPNKWPWQASLQLTHPQYGKVGHWCGAVVIHKQWVMTAAHCILNPLFSLPQPVFWKVRVGDHNLKLTEGHEKTIQVSEVHFHPWYQGYDKDIALLKLEKEMEFDDYVRAACLPGEDDGFLGMRCIATGWGKVDFDKKGSNVLREVEIQVLDNSVCHAAYYPTYNIAIKGWHLCAGELEGGKGTCQGDSGGPLQCLMNGQYYVVGITSFGSGCAKEGFPDIYTTVSYFADWIEEIMSRPPAPYGK